VGSAAYAGEARRVATVGVLEAAALIERARGRAASADAAVAVVEAAVAGDRARRTVRATLGIGAPAAAAFVAIEPATLGGEHAPSAVRRAGQRASANAAEAVPVAALRVLRAG
jgi:hypothetical protein